MDAILGFLNNPPLLTLIGVGWGLLIKFHPAFKAWPNAAIPWLNALLALLVKLGSPEPAHAEMIMGAAVLPAAGGFLAHLLSVGVASGWQAVQQSLLYEVFLRHPLAGVLQKQPSE